MRGDKAAHGVDQVALDVGAEDGLAVPVGAGDQVAVDDQRRRALDQVDQDVLLAIQRLAGQAGQKMGHRDRIADGEVLHRLRRDDVRQREQAERAGFLCVGEPSHEEAP